MKLRQAKKVIRKHNLGANYRISTLQRARLRTSPWRDFTIWNVIIDKCKQLFAKYQLEDWGADPKMLDYKIWLSSPKTTP